MLVLTLDAVLPCRHRRGHPRWRPDKLCADKAYGPRRECRARGIRPRIALRGIESIQCLAVRYEQRADIFHAFTTLGYALVCRNQIRWFR